MRARYCQVCGRVARGRGDPRGGPGQRPGQPGQLQGGRGQIPAGPVSHWPIRGRADTVTANESPVFAEVS